MATLTGNSIASTYTGLLSVSGAVGADTVEAVTDGAGTSTSLSLSQQRATITLGSGAGDDFIVDGTTLVVEGDNNRVGIGTDSPARQLHVHGGSGQGEIHLTGTSTGVALTDGSTITTSGLDLLILNRENGDTKFYNNGSVNMTIDSAGDVTVSTGNLVIGTHGKGIDFSANTDDATPDSGGEVLDDYEEGTWTPNFASGTNLAYTTQSGTYTKIGRMVYCTGQMVVSNSDNDDSTVKIGGLPFNVHASITSGLFLFGRYTDFLGAKLPDFTNVRYVSPNYVLLLEGNNDGITYTDIASSGTVDFSLYYEI